jgi:hypothetical protein
MLQEIKAPNISEETKQAIIKFFMKTSVPRILKEMEEKHYESSYQKS